VDCTAGLDPPWFPMLAKLADFLLRAPTNDLSSRPLFPFPLPFSVSNASPFPPFPVVGATAAVVASGPRLVASAGTSSIVSSAIRLFETPASAHTLALRPEVVRSEDRLEEGIDDDARDVGDSSDAGDAGDPGRPPPSTSTSTSMASPERRLARPLGEPITSSTSTTTPGRTGVKGVGVVDDSPTVEGAGKPSSSEPDPTSLSPGISSSPSASNADAASSPPSPL
jgi:hypothetical protein